MFGWLLGHRHIEYEIYCISFCWCNRSQHEYVSHLQISSGSQQSLGRTSRHRITFSGFKRPGTEAIKIFRTFCWLAKSRLPKQAWCCKDQAKAQQPLVRQTTNAKESWKKQGTSDKVNTLFALLIFLLKMSYVFCHTTPRFFKALWKWCAKNSRMLQFLAQQQFLLTQDPHKLHVGVQLFGSSLSMFINQKPQNHAESW